MSGALQWAIVIRIKHETIMTIQNGYKININCYETPML